MRATSPLALLLGLTLLVGGAPALTGCDANGEVCAENTDEFSTEDITPDGTALGPAIQVGQCVTVAYVGRLNATGELFDEGSFPFTYSSSASLIRGFVLGMSGQQVNETRRVVIPPSLGYGDQALDGRNGNAGIPSCSTLQFDITVTAINADPRVCGNR